MRMPPRLAPLIEDGIIDRVVRPLMSGKEAQVYLVQTGDELRVAKVYKGETERTFRNRSEYTEGRHVRNSRDRRAMGKRTRHGREQDEATWKAAEADTIYRLDAAGVRVPKPYAFVDGVLVMECVQGPEGGVAPRLAECTLEPAHAQQVFEQLIREVVKMLCAGIVHGDLSVYNILLEADGPVIIDFPQAIDAAQNRNARNILLRDVANLTSHFKRGIPSSELRFAHEMWSLFERGELRPDAPMTGRFALPKHEVDAERLLEQMMQVEEDEAEAEEGQVFEFVAPKRGARVVGTVDLPPTRSGRPPRGAKKPPAGPQVVVKGRAPEGGELPPPLLADKPASPKPEGAPKKRRRRRRGGGRGGGSTGGNASGGTLA